MLSLVKVRNGMATRSKSLTTLPHILAQSKKTKTGKMFEIL